MNNLFLTTPYLSNGQVKEAQEALKTNNFRQFYKDDIDGQYGPKTASATKDAKHWLGYSKKNLNSVYGASLHSLLTGASKPTNLQKKRIRARKRQAAKRTIGNIAFEIAYKEIGTKESPPNSNNVKYSYWYGVPHAPWCAMFVSWVYVKAGAKSFDPKKSRWAYCPYMVNDARAERNGLVATKEPEQGDIVLFDWDNDGVADHVGLFDKWINNISFNTIEGNTSASSDSNGGEVQSRRRNISDVIEFAKVVTNN